MKKTFILVILIILFYQQNCFSQKQADNWYFGKKAGVSFASSTPVALLDGLLETEEGCAAISDINGKLLFYSDGITVWNAEHNIMKNGDSLKGHPSSTSSGVAIPKPNSINEYYLFTLAESGNINGLCYSLIDMNLENGLGSVISNKKNINLATTVTEKLTAVKHRNGKDIWVIAHRWLSDEFISLLITEKGVSKEPIVSKIGMVHQGSTTNTQGYMKSNPDGTNIALALEDDHIFELFDFDNETGLLSHPMTFKLPDKSYAYGIEFSPDGSIFYGSAAGTGKIYQWNLQAGSEDSIRASEKIVGSSPDNKWIGALQIANDGKIYFPIYGTSYLGVINKPNLIGSDCAYENNSVSLGDRKTTLGLPTFTQSFFIQNQTKNTISYFKEDKIEKNKTFILNNILFDFGKFTLQSVSFPELQKLVAILKKKPDYKIEISGHTDNIGNKTSNIILSKNRAEAVKNYLISQKINPDRITTIGYGSSHPILNNDTDLNKSKNRRVEFILSE